MTTHLFTYPKVVPVPRPGQITVTPAPSVGPSGAKADAPRRAA